jgi:hypothetical protein
MLKGGVILALASANFGTLLVNFSLGANLTLLEGVIS